jgi:hypothetical protein
MRSAVLALLVVGAVNVAQSQSVLVRGRVFRADSTPLGGATITGAFPDGSHAASETSDRNGMYLLKSRPGQRRLRVSTRMVGYLPKEEEIELPAGVDVVFHDVYLSRVPLPAARVTARVPRRPRSQDGNGANAEGSARAGRTPGVLLGNNDQTLRDIAATVPGATSASGGFSLAGMPPSWNAAVMNGMTAMVSALPRGVVGSSAVISSSFDPSVGGFAGGLVSIQTLGGSNLSQRIAHVTLDAPPLQVRAPGPPDASRAVRDIQLSGSADGALRFDSAFYTLAAQIGRRRFDANPFELQSHQVLESFGLSSDSATRLLSLFARDHLTDVIAPSTESIAENASVFARLDFLRPQNRSISLIGAAQAGWTHGGVNNPFATASSGLRAVSGSGSIQASYSRYLSARVLNETRLALGLSARRTSPVSSTPSALVLVQSEEMGMTQVPVFGGGSLVNRDDDTEWSAEAKNESSWISENGSHRWRLALNLLLGTQSRTRELNRQGTFVFQSLDDYALGRASRFNRSFGPGTTEATVLSSAASLGDLWQARPSLRIQYGVRVDGHVILDLPDLNPDAIAFLGTSGPGAWRASVSPRLGFSWDFRRSTSPTARAPDPLWTLRGGLGAFQGAWRPSFLLGANGGTEVRDLVCTGTATPSPDWSGFSTSGANAPTSCLSQTGTSVQRSTLISLLGPRSSPPRSWRATLGLSTDLFRTLHLDADALLSLGWNSAGRIDQNLIEAPVSSLAAEGPRPLFAPSGSIDERSGLINPASSRRLSLFGSANETVTDLRSRAQSFTLMVTPYRLSRQQVYLAYAHTRSDQQVRGFDGSTAGDPRRIEWATSPDERRHQFTAGGTFVWSGGWSADLYMRFESGIPFTPLVNGDINGDGLANDRAFIFDNPASDSEATSQVASVLSNPEAHRCLMNQRNQVARHNSCFGPWTSSSGLQLNLPPRLAGLSERVKVSLAFVNVPAIVDRLVNGSHSHGWGQPAIPDPVLLNVRGFDATTRRFDYSANANFANARNTQRAPLDPFRITLNVRASLGVDPDKQVLGEQLRQVASVPGVPQAERIRDHLRRNIPNVALAVLRMRDSLQLDSIQITRLTNAAREYDAGQRQIWTPFAEYLVTLKLDYTAPGAVDKYRSAKEAAYRSTANMGVAVRNLLTEGQLRRLSSALRRYFDPDAVMRSMMDRF